MTNTTNTTTATIDNNNTINAQEGATTMTTFATTLNNDTLKSVDWYQAKSESRERVHDFMYRFVWKKAVSLQHEKSIKEATEAVDSAKKLKDTLDRAQYLDIKDRAEEKLRKAKEAKAKQIKAECKWDFEKHDRIFKKAVAGLKKGDTKIEEAVIALMKEETGIDVSGTTFLKEVLDNMGMKDTVDEIVRTDGTDAQVLDHNNALRRVYSTMFTQMVQAGAIKKVTIPEEVQGWYKEKQEKKAKRRSRKARKNNTESK